MPIAYYDETRGRLAFLWDSYWGGDRYRNPSSTTIGTARLTKYQQRRDDKGNLIDDFDEVDVCSYRTYLVPHPGESKREFEVRLALAVFVAFPKTLVESYVEAVVAPVTRDLGELGPYLANLNGRGRTWGDHVEDVARWSQVYGWTATVIEPPPKNPAANRAEEERLRVGLRAIHVHPTAVAWIDVDRNGTVQEFAFCDAPYVPRDSAPAQIKVRLYVYTATEWRAYDVAMRPGAALSAARELVAKQEPNDRGDLPPIGRVPVEFAFFTEDTSSAFPLGQSAIDDAADAARQVYNELSWIEEIHRKTAFPFLAIPEQQGGGDLDPRTRVQVGPSAALGYDSGTGAPQWVQPDAESVAELRTHALFLIMLAVRMAGLEVTLDAGTGANESGVAIELRNRRFNATCTRLAKNLAAYEAACFDLARAMLGRPELDAAVAYPKRFVLPSPSEDLDRLIRFVGTFGANLPASATEEVLRQAAEAALRLSDEDLAMIMADVRAKLGQAQAPRVELNSFNTPWAKGNEVRATMGLAPVPEGEVIPIVEDRKRAQQPPAPPIEGA